MHHAHDLWLFVLSRLIAFEAPVGVQVHHEDQLATLEGQHFVHQVADRHELVLRAEPLEAVLQRLHELVEVLEVPRSQSVR